MLWPLKVRLRSNELNFGYFDFSWRRRRRRLSLKLQHVDLLPQVKNRWTQMDRGKVTVVLGLRIIMMEEEDSLGGPPIHRYTFCS